MKNRFLPACWVVLAIGIVACGGETPTAAAPVQTSKHSFPEAIKMMCNVDQLAGLSPSDDVLAIGRLRSAWLADNVDNGDFIEFRTLVSVKMPEDQVSKIRTKAKEFGIESCPLADSIKAEPEGVLIP